MSDRTVVLVGCGSAKRDEPAPARDLYTSTYFRLKREYAETVGDAWYVLSAEHGVVPPDRVLEPYDLSAADLTSEGRDEWARDVVDALEGRVGPDDELVVLAGRDYVLPLRRRGLSFARPLEGLGIGEQMGWLREQVDAAAGESTDDGDTDDRDGGHSSTRVGGHSDRDAADEYDRAKQGTLGIATFGSPDSALSEGERRVREAIASADTQTDRPLPDRDQYPVDYAPTRANADADYRALHFVAGVSKPATRTLLNNVGSARRVIYFAKNRPSRLTRYTGIGDNTVTRIRNLSDADVVTEAEAREQERQATADATVPGEDVASADADYTDPGFTSVDAPAEVNGWTRRAPSITSPGYEWVAPGTRHDRRGRQQVDVVQVFELGGAWTAREVTQYVEEQATLSGDAVYRFYHRQKLTSPVRVDEAVDAAVAWMRENPAPGGERA